MRSGSEERKAGPTKSPYEWRIILEATISKSVGPMSIFPCVFRIQSVDVFLEEPRPELMPFHLCHIGIKIRVSMSRRVNSLNFS